MEMFVGRVLSQVVLKLDIKIQLDQNKDGLLQHLFHPLPKEHNRLSKIYLTLWIRKISGGKASLRMYH